MAKQPDQGTHWHARARQQQLRFQRRDAGQPRCAAIDQPGALGVGAARAGPGWRRFNCNPPPAIRPWSSIGRWRFRAPASSVRGAILNTGGDNTWAGPITFDALPGFSPDTFPVGRINIGVANAGDSLTILGPISETETTGLTNVGAGELVLAQANTYSGATEIVEGTVDVRDPGALGASLRHRVDPARRHPEPRRPARSV